MPAAAHSAPRQFPNDPEAEDVHRINRRAIRGSSGGPNVCRMYTVEVRHDGDGLAEPIADIRTWLDHRRIQPSVFRLSLIPGSTIVHLEFKAAGHAEGFARVLLLTDS